MANVFVRFLSENEVSKTVEQIDKDMGGMAKSIGSKLALVAGAAAGVGVVIKEAFDLGAQGAAVKQTAASFDLLLEKIGAAPDLLDQLREKSNGTIADFELMQSTMTLLAGTSGDLATELANSMPQLLEYAKAANKLNPSLGDTAFLFDSLARGIKRGSPLLIDNTGIVLKLGEANEKMAASLGKTVEELTAEEQKIAILRATMEAGKTMLDQAGGSADSATDSFAQFDANVQNLTNNIKMALVPALNDAVTALNVMMTFHKKIDDALTTHIAETATSAKTWEEYAAEVERAGKAAGYNVRVHEDGIEIMGRWGAWIGDQTGKLGVLNKAQFEAGHTADKLGNAFKVVQASAGHSALFVDRYINSLQVASNAQKQAADGAKEVASFIITGAEASKYAAGYAELAAAKTITYAQATAQLKQEESDRLLELMKLRKEEQARLGQQMTEVAIAGQLAGIYKDYRSSLADLQADNADLVSQYNELISGQDDYSRAISDTIKQNAELNAEYARLMASGTATEEQLIDIRNRIAENATEQEKASSAAAERIAELNRAITDNNEKMREATELMKKQTAELIYQQASQGLSSEAALVLARGLGLVSEVDYKLILQIQQLRAEFDANSDGMIEASEGAATYTAKIIDLYNAQVKLNEATIQYTKLNAQALGALGGGAGGAPQGPAVGAGMVNLGGGIYQYTAPGGGGGGGAGNGIYVGGPGQVVGPGAGPALVVNNVNNGVSLNNEAELQRILTPIVQNIINGR